MREVSQVINGKRVIVKKPELLAPAGNLEKLKVAILYGADAVFIGGKEFSLRSSASNFSLDDIKEAVEFAHAHHAAIHVTCNIILPCRCQASPPEVRDAFSSRVRSLTEG